MSKPNLVAITTSVSNRRQRFAQQFLVDEWAIGFSRIKEGYTSVVGRPDERDHFLFVGGRAVTGTHAHAAKAQRRNFRGRSFQVCAFAFSCLLRWLSGLIRSLPDQDDVPSLMTLIAFRERG